MIYSLRVTNSKRRKYLTKCPVTKMSRNWNVHILKCPWTKMSGTYQETKRADHIVPCQNILQQTWNNSLFEINRICFPYVPNGEETFTQLQTFFRLLRESLAQPSIISIREIHYGDANFQHFYQTFLETEIWQNRVYSLFLKQYFWKKNCL